MALLRSALLNPLLYVVLLLVAVVRIVADPASVIPITYIGIVALLFGLVAALVARAPKASPDSSAAPNPNALSGPAAAVALAAGMGVGLSGLALVGLPAVFLGILTTAVACEAIPVLAPAGLWKLAGNRKTPWGQILLLSLIVGAALGFFATVQASATSI